VVVPVVGALPSASGAGVAGADVDGVALPDSVPFEYNV